MMVKSRRLFSVLYVVVTQSQLGAPTTIDKHCVMNYGLIIHRKREALEELLGLF